jgi:hypothetical protein
MQSSSTLSRAEDAFVKADAPSVLIVVDEAPVGRMLARVFKRAGINGLWMGGLGPSLEWLRENPGAVPQAFVDCPCLRDDIVDFCRNSLVINPGLQVFLAGGTDMQGTASTLAAFGSTLYVPKPYLPTELAWQMRAPAGKRAA